MTLTIPGERESKTIFTIYLYYHVQIRDKVYGETLESN